MLLCSICHKYFITEMKNKISGRAQQSIRNISGHMEIRWAEHTNKYSTSLSKLSDSLLVIHCWWNKQLLSKEETERRARAKQQNLNTYPPQVHHHLHFFIFISWASPWNFVWRNCFSSSLSNPHPNYVFPSLPDTEQIYSRTDFLLLP